MKKSIIIILILLTALALAFLGYRHLNEQKDINLWELVPSNTLIVYESNQFTKNWNHISRTKLWQSLENIPYFKNIGLSIANLDSAAGYDGQLDNLLRGNPFIMSGHLISKNEIDFVFYLQLNTLGQKDAGLRLIKKFKEDPNVKINQRLYLGNEINELKLKDGKTFHYIMLKNCFIGSFTAFLIEDVLRTYETESKDNFLNHQASLFELTHLNEGQGDFYINTTKLSSFVRLATNEQLPELQQLLDRLAEGSFLDIKISDQNLLLNGFSLSTNEQNLLHTFIGQNGKGFQVKNFVPNRTAYLMHMSFENAPLWYERLMKFNVEIDSIQYKSSMEESRKYRTDFKEFYRFMHEEVAVATMSPIGNEKPEKLLFVRSNDINETLNEINKLAEDAAEQMGDSIYWESFAGERIGQLFLEEFPYLWLGKMFRGFENSFYTTIGQYLIISNSLQCIKNLINDLEAENTWGKSLRQTNFLQGTLSDANLSVYINIPRSWDMMMSNMNSNWQKALNENQYTFKSFDLMALQFSQVDNKFYTNVDVQFKYNPLQEQSNRFAVEQEINFDVPIISKPYVVRNHNNNHYEVMVQDSSLALHLIGSSGQIIWTDTLAAKLSTDIHQIDFYNNGKLQYIFAIDNVIHIIDRNGVRVENWPLNLSSNIKINTLSVVDYDRSKNYRFMISDTEGNIYLLNKDKVMLDGWKPKKIGGKITGIPRHVRIRARDFMFAMQEEGKIHLMNRKGEMQKGFPLAVGDRLETAMFFDIGSSVDNSYLVSITEGGELIKANMVGQISIKQQLYKPTARTSFQLVEDGLKRTFIVIRQDMNRVSVLNKEGILRFDKDFMTDEQMRVQYYHFGTNNEIIAITDEKQEFTYMYNATGELIHYQPLESSFPIAMLHFESENKFFVYKCYRNKLSIVSFFQ